MSTAQFPIDANLPRRFGLWAGPEFVFAHDFGERLPDADIWDHARAHGLTIVTKNADFQIRVLIATPPPKVVHVHFGNLKMRDFFTAMQARWPEAIALLPHYKLIEIFVGQVVAIS